MKLDDILRKETIITSSGTTLEVPTTRKTRIFDMAEFNERLKSAVALSGIMEEDPGHAPDGSDEPTEIKRIQMDIHYARMAILDAYLKERQSLELPIPVKENIDRFLNSHEG